MPTYIALLRGINVGRKRMKMDTLREMFESVGYANPKTLLASGNVIFQTDETDRDTIIQTLEYAIVETFDFDSKIILRTGDAWQEAITNCPYLEQSEQNPKHLLVTFLSNIPSDITIANLHSAHEGSELINVIDQTLYIYYADGVARSKLTNNVIEKQLQVAGTARNWNTVLKIHDLYQKFSD